MREVLARRLPISKIIYQIRVDLFDKPHGPIQVRILEMPRLL
jgi:hypothetical protein